MTNPFSRDRASARANNQPKDATGVLVLSDGSVFWGKGLGAEGASTGELCFNTSMTGYQEITTDPSYAGQIITFTFPHIGNTGINMQDIETAKPSVRGVVLREAITTPSSWRAAGHLEDWLERSNLIGLSGLDTRALTIRIRDVGAPNAVIAHDRKSKFDLDALRKQAAEWPGLEGMDLAKEVTCAMPYEWNEGTWKWFPQKHAAYTKANNAGRHHVVAIDYGAKRNILRCLVNAGCRVTVVPATATADEIFALKPDGVFLSNGPGDPAATGVYAVPVIKALLDKNMPIFGICLGHQILALALGAKTAKMPRGHRGANHPVKDLFTGKVDITSQNHGFMVLPETLPASAEVTHISLFDKTNEGIRLKDKPAFSIQYHPEGSPGPHDSHYLFKRFVEMIEREKERKDKGLGGNPQRLASGAKR
ncbi:MAG: glutamine-hydrolyzing carbamoyl-phosphate synthase small subunit [Alphaproteobacteria bacterium]|nr:glutamine-hydrolyzing carbamoyl-phosphate synthase small subunit [Alphaproteobacteria bacterium]